MVDALDASPILLGRAIESTENGNWQAIRPYVSRLRNLNQFDDLRHRDRGLSSGKTGATLATPQIAADRG